MIEWTRYNFVTGRILSCGRCDYSFVFQQALTDEEHVLAGAHIDGAIWYMPDGIKTARPSLDIVTEHTIAADGVDAVQIALPPGSQVESLPDGEMWSDEAEFYFSTEEAGTFSYRIYLPFPYQDPFKVTIHAA